MLKEVAKKAIKETVKQRAKEIKKDVLKGKLKQAVKAETKEEVKDKVAEEIDDKVKDVGEAKGAGLKDKLSQAVKGQDRERVMDTATKSEPLEQNSYVTIEGESYRTDDNGNIYQKRNSETRNYEGLPNNSYELNGYHYETDSQGRIEKASGTLQERNHEGRRTINDNVDGMKGNDEKGHLIGDQFNGSNLNGNLVAMDFDVNRSDYKKLEEKLSKGVNEGHKKVEYSIEPKYEGDSNRPTKFVVKYTMDGETFKETFKN